MYLALLSNPKCLHDLRTAPYTKKGTGTCELAFPDKREDETWWDGWTNTKMYNYR